jgi:SAM-dependent methyltransferase
MKPEVIEFKVGSPLNRTPAPSYTPQTITDPEVLKDSIMARFQTRIYSRGEIVIPSVPSLVDYFVQGFEEIFVAIGKAFTPEELQTLREILLPQLAQGFQASPHSNVILRYEPSESGGITYTVSNVVASMTDQYKTWVDTREPPLFGSHPDTKLLEVAKSLGSPHQINKINILDIGAGTGRNTLPLARLGYGVDALEMTPIFAEQIEAAAQAEQLSVRVYNADILSPLVRMAPAYYSLAVAAEVVSHFRDADQLRLLLAKMCDGLHSGGIFLFNTFLCIDGYEPDQLTREMSEVNWSTIFTYEDIAYAMHDLPLELLEEIPVYDYEKANLPAEAWPPTGWFDNWANGRDLFWLPDQKPPMELRWLVCRRL